MSVIWVNSADSHILEPADLWLKALPEPIARNAPRITREMTDRGEREMIYLEGRQVRRDVPALVDAMRPPGAGDFARRLADLDREGIWAELGFPSVGLWTAEILDPATARECAKVYNDWCAAEYMSRSSRFVGAAIVSMVDTDDAVAELRRCVDLGFQAVFLASTPPEDRPYNSEVWDPLWKAAEETGVVICVHIGTGTNGTTTRGRGGAVINYLETFFPAQRTVAHLAASGALDRHPDLKVLIAEGGSSWIPALADRMDEAYRQHGMFVRPKLSMLPSELIFRQVYTSFQHDRSAVPAMWAMGYHNVMWGSDYPHLEGTFPNTQPVLKGLFDDVDPEVRRAITIDNFSSLFSVPDIGASTH